MMDNHLNNDSNMSKVNLIVFGFNPWSNFWKRNQTITYFLSKSYIIEKVLFLNSDIWLADLIKNFQVVFSQPNINRWRAILPRRVTDKITVFTPCIFPGVKRFKLLNKLNDYYNGIFINKFLRTPYIVLLNDPQANQQRIDSVLNNSKFTIFDWSDDFVEFSSNLYEREICWNKCIKYCKNSDIILAVNENLKEKAKQLNINSFTIKNATNFFSFSNNSRNDYFSDFAPKNNYVVGYIGYLNSLRLDLDLIFYLIIQRPDIQFVFMGPKTEKDPFGKRILLMPNVHILKPVPYSDYPSYLSALDVCILPNRVNSHTNGNDPIKIYDYLASGNPIVTTKTAGTESFTDLLYCAGNKKEFLDLLDLACLEKSKFLRQKRIDIGRQNSWQNRYKDISKILRKHFEVYMEK